MASWQRISEAGNASHTPSIGENHPVPLERVGVRDVFGTSGDPDELLAEYGLDAAGIVAKAKAAVARK